MATDKRLKPLVPQHGDKVYLGDRKTPFYVIGFKMLHKEVACVVGRSGDVQGPKERKALKVGKELAAVVPVADLVRDHARRGWREKWRQQDFFQEEGR